MFRLFRWTVFFVAMTIAFANLHDVVQNVAGMFLDARYVMTVLRDRTFPRTVEEQDRNVEERPFFLRDEYEAAKLIVRPLLRAYLLEERADFRREKAEKDEQQYADPLRPFLRWMCLELNMC